MISEASYFHTGFVATPTSRGHNQCGPPRMSSDDIIYVANTPFLIWKDVTSSDAKLVCNLVGECYLHGMMMVKRKKSY